ncbi:MAG: HAD-IA family hydrolase [Oscillospiraceae bacterium]|nr:HAD-IA family hydrolase [Oscillospiraceae bacterium]
MKVGILWDLDGTLLDTLQDLTDGTNHALREHDLPERTVGEVRQFVGNGARKLIERAVDGRADVDKVLESFYSYYNAHCQEKTAPYPGILDALEELGKQYPMAVVSNKPDSAVKPLCGQYFPGVYARGESIDCPRKPAPDMVYKAMEAVGVETCIYVGDSEVDVATAKNAKVPCLSVLWGFRDKEVMVEAGAKYFCEKPEELPEMIEKIVGEVYGK